MNTDESFVIKREGTTFNLKAGDMHAIVNISGAKD